jgi:hypothetical protein
MRTLLQSIYVKNLNSNPRDAVFFLTIGKGNLSHDRVYLQGIFCKWHVRIAPTRLSFRFATLSAAGVPKKPSVTILVPGFITVKAS